MVKLDRLWTPIQLTPRFVQQKTQEFIDSGKNVWNIAWLKTALLELSNNKCAYCECDITEESKYLEVEHFKCKSTFKNEVLVWDNLLPSCKRCNGKKGSHNVVIDPIINPCEDEPSTHLYMYNYRFKGKDQKGRDTIDVIGLNDTERLVKVRFDIGNSLEDTIDNVKEKLENYKQKSSTKNKNSLIKSIEDILRLCQKDRQYSATCSTVLHQDNDYKYIKSEMEKLELWSNEMEELHQNSLRLVLEK